ncbi:MAG: DUF1631 family protein, partial [Pseudomonadota bacterium]
MKSRVNNQITEQESIPTGVLGTNENNKMVRLIEYCREITANRAGDIFNEFSMAFEDAIRINVDEAMRNQEFTYLSRDSQAFSTLKSSLKQYFIDEINHGFDLFKQQLAANAQDRSKRSSKKTFSLINKNDLEEIIAITAKNTPHKYHFEFQDELFKFENEQWCFEQHLSNLCARTSIKQESNPVSPLQFIAALRSTLKLAKLSYEAKNIAYRVFSTIIPVHLASLFPLLNNYFLEQKAPLVIQNINKVSQVHPVDIENVKNQYEAAAGKQDVQQAAVVIPTLIEVVPEISSGQIENDKIQSNQKNALAHKASSYHHKAIVKSIEDIQFSEALLTDFIEKTGRYSIDTFNKAVLKKLNEAYSESELNRDD